MIKTKITLAFLALFVLAGCNANKKPRNMDMRSAEEAPIEVEFDRTVGSKVWFDYDSSALSQQSKERLEKQACWFEKHPDMKATIEGHCDCRGTREYNLALGERRANAVKKFLVHCGVCADRLCTHSYGKEKPAVLGDNEEAWCQNRRAVTVVHK